MMDEVGILQLGLKTVNEIGALDLLCSLSALSCGWKISSTLAQLSQKDGRGAILKEKPSPEKLLGNSTLTGESLGRAV